VHTKDELRILQREIAAIQQQQSQEEEEENSSYFAVARGNA
jgi:hypothetical protein